MIHLSGMQTYTYESNNTTKNFKFKLIQVNRNENWDGNGIKTTFEKQLTNKVNKTEVKPNNFHTP